MAGHDSPLSASIVRNLSDKTYEKRKTAALDIEGLVKGFITSGQSQRISDVVVTLNDQFTNNLANAHSRKGGLIGLAATAIGLGVDNIEPYLNDLVVPVLRCFRDQESTVRYYACEAMYNISKMSRGHILVWFNDIFDGLCKLSSDLDHGVKNGAQLLDRLIKDIVTESETFDVEKFIPLLERRVHILNPFVRQFLVGWIAVLDSVPEIGLFPYLPKFLDGLFKMLSDINGEIRRMADGCLAEFLRVIEEEEFVDFKSMTPIIVEHCESEDEFTKFTALIWINKFVVVGKEVLLEYSAVLLGSVLPSLSHEAEEISHSAAVVNKNLLQLLWETKDAFEVEPVIHAATSNLGNEWVATRLAALRWMLMLHIKLPDSIIALVDVLFPALLKTLSDNSEKVVRLVLEVLAKISSVDHYFQLFMETLLELFSTDRQLLEYRGSLIIRQLCIFLKPDQTFLALASHLVHEEDLDFARIMVQTLNLILLTSPELADLRSRLKRMRDTQDEMDVRLFDALYTSWCHNPVSTFSLCLLAQAYEHACDLVQKFADFEVTVAFLIEIDKLVQLLESPIFTHLRLQLLEPARHQHLFKCLYGVLMLLPQSSAFNALRTRLNSVSNLGTLQLMPPSKDVVKGFNTMVDFVALLERFSAVQAKHAALRRKVVKHPLPEDSGPDDASRPKRRLLPDLHPESQHRDGAGPSLVVKTDAKEEKP